MLRRIGLFAVLLAQGCVTYKTAWKTGPAEGVMASFVPGASLKVERSSLSLKVADQRDGALPRVSISGIQAVSGPEQQVTSYTKRRETREWSPLLPLGAILALIECPIFVASDKYSYTCGHNFCSTMLYGLVGIFPGSNMNAFGQSQGGRANCQEESQAVKEERATGKRREEFRPLGGAGIKVTLTAEDPAGQVMKSLSMDRRLKPDGSFSVDPSGFYESLRSSPRQVTATAALADDPSVRAQDVIGPERSERLFKPIAEERAGDEAAKGSDAQAAIDHYAKAYRWRYDDGTRVWKKLARAYTGMDRHPPLPEEAERLKVQAGTFVKDRRFGDAQRSFEQLLQLAPWFPAGHFDLALIYANGKFYAQAIDEMRRYLDLGPDAADASKARDHIYTWEALAR